MRRRPASSAPLAAASGEGITCDATRCGVMFLSPLHRPLPVERSSHVLLHRRHMPSSTTNNRQNTRSKALVEMQQSCTLNLRPAAQCKTVPIRRIWRNVVHLQSQVAGLRAGKRRSTPGRTCSLNLFYRSGTFHGRILEVPCISCGEPAVRAVRCRFDVDNSVSTTAWTKWVSSIYPPSCLDVRSF